MQPLKFCLYHELFIPLVSPTDINYFHCKKIIELLKEDEESGKKNMFGRYSSQRMKVSENLNC